MEKKDCLRTKILPEFNCSNCDHLMFEKLEILNSEKYGYYAVECKNFVHPLQSCVLRGFQGHSAQPGFSLTLNK